MKVMSQRTNGNKIKRKIRNIKYRGKGLGMEGKTIGIRHESQGLFHPSSPLCSTACTSIEAPLLLHCCLGHPSLSKFRKLVPHFSSLSSLECESCQLEKHTRVLFPKCLNPRTKSPFELVHIDAWGPSMFTSMQNYLYLSMLGNNYLYSKENLS